VRHAHRVHYMAALRNLNAALAAGSDLALLSQSLSEEYVRLRDRFLPLIPENSIWRMSRGRRPGDAEQGWKLHLSATILSANEMFRRVAPLLSASRVLFKAPVSLQELSKLNCGLHYGFSQIGKFITVYPATADEALSLARRLHEITDNLPGPAVPYDLPFNQNGCVYYRYGAFGSLEIENPDGTRTSAIRNPEGELVPDLRQFGTAVPDWEADIFSQPPGGQEAPDSDNPLKVIKVFKALSQRGRGGVYHALDLRAAPARLCILKEGRRHGETDWRGRDGYWRVRHEAETLRLLAAAGINVPEVYLTFELSENYYLVTEYIEGENLQSRLGSARKKMPWSQALDCGIQLGEMLDKMHSAGWVWRDCKPLNLMVAPEGVLRPLDFEGACRVDSPDEMPWGTPGYILPERLEYPAKDSRVPDDLFALGATLHQLISGQTPGATYPPPPIGKLRRRVPAAVKEIISALLDPDPLSRPDARTVSRALKSASENLFSERPAG
jgi:hypothetical protein